MSYSTVEEADAYVASHYISNDPMRLTWDALIPADKQSLLNKSAAIIDSLPLTGRRTNRGQKEEFPRCGATEVPDAVKNAECELALTYSDSSKSADADQYRKMIQYGISSYSIGNFSESLLSYQRNNLQLQYGLISVEAERLLQPWLSGGFCIE